MYGRSEQTISIQTSTGETAKAEIDTPDGKYTTDIPTKLTAEKGWGGITIEVVDECYNRSTTEVSSAIDNAFWLNAFNGFTFFWWDLLTSSMFEFDQTTVVDLDKKVECKGNDIPAGGKKKDS